MPTPTILIATSGSGVIPKQSTINVRPMVEGDVGTIAEFNMLHKLEIEKDHLDKATVIEGLVAVLEGKASARYYVAEIDNEVVGCMMTTYEFSEWRNGNMWYIQSVYTKATHRGQGVFTALYQAVEEDCKIFGGVELRLYVKSDNLQAQEVYKKLGFCDTGYVIMNKELSPESD